MSPTTIKVPVPANRSTVPTTTAARITTPTTTAAPALAARRQPPAAEINQVISTVHGLFPLYTPTGAEIGAIGDKVCTAFDQGQSFSVVKSTFLQMVGAGAYAALVPASVPDAVVRTMVPMYCPGYGSKLV